MTAGSREHAALDRLARAARDDAPAAERDAELDSMAERAVAIAAGPRPRSARARAAAVAVAVLATAAAGVAFTVLRDGDQGPNGVATSERPSRIELPGGDVLLSTSGTELVVQDEDGARVLLLEEGSVLCDVAPLRDGRAFEVVTPELRAVVRGTVFTVTAEAGRARVQVFEGRVEVLTPTRRVHLGAGDSFDSAEGGEAVGWDSPLASEGRWAAQRRAVHDRPRPEDTATAVAAERGSDDALVEQEPAPPPEAQPRAPTRPVEPAPSLAEARAWLLAGRHEDVARAARRAARTRTADRGEWLLLEGDALRALGDRARAADAYERAASATSPSRATQAGYLAAALRFEQGEHDAALGALDASRADRSGSPVEERAMLLRARVLIALGRREEATRVARAYLAAFPGGGSREWMQSLAGPVTEREEP